MQTASRTNRGLVRKNNEDSILVRCPDLFAIADGMGGEQAGEVASSLSVHYLSKVDLSGVQDGEILKYLREVIETINAKVWQMTVDKPELKGMGTTLTAIYLKKDKGFVGHVGDSRIYLWQEGVLKQVTSDHSYVAEMVRMKKLTPSEAESSDQKHMILRAVGATPFVEVDTFEFLLAGSQKVLLCSDGLSNMVAEETISKALSGKDIEAAADQLMQEALKAGGKDNVSFIIIDVED